MLTDMLVIMLNLPLLNWDHIDTVLLDMDGTLLDLHFDDYFWQEHLPLRYAEQQQIGLDTARTRLHTQYEHMTGTLDWYCLDYWSQALSMDIVSFKEEISHLITFRPEAVEFLAALQAHHKRSVLVTNAHGHSLALKLRKTGLDQHLNHIYCAHDLGLPKENPDFWGQLQKEEPFLAHRTLLIDDNLAALASARQAGLAFLIAIAQPNSQRAARQITEFPAIHDFSEIIPAIPTES